jgi:hypothetical protein
VFDPVFATSWESEGSLSSATLTSLSSFFVVSFDNFLLCIGDIRDDLFDLASLHIVSTFIFVGLDEGVDSIKTSVVVRGKLS